MYDATENFKESERLELFVLTPDANVWPYQIDPQRSHATFHRVGDFRIREKVAHDGASILN